MRALLAFALVATAVTVGSLVARPATAGEPDCHAQQICPAADGSYVWSDGQTQWRCYAADPSGAAADGATVIEYDGERYSCVPAADETTTTTTTTTTTPPPTTTVAPPSPPPPARKKASSGHRSSAAPARAPVGGTATGSGRAPIRSGPGPTSASLPPGTYVFPVDGPASFGNDFGAPRADTGWHHGNDIFAPLGTPILAVTAGTLSKVGWNAVGGNRLWLGDRNGNFYYYAHLSGFAPGVHDGVAVAAGAVIGYVGNTGDAAGTPYHLHFEIHPASLIGLGYDGVVNPYHYLTRWPHLEDLRVARTGQAASVDSRAPTPGAFLLTASDISSASGLDRGAVVARVNARVRVEERPALRALPPASSVELPRQAGILGAGRLGALDAGANAGLDVGGANVWDALAQCESGGNWHLRTGNGFFGGLQFLPQTWVSFGGAEFAPSAELATREQQITIARRVLESQGWDAWPACSLELGLR